MASFADTRIFASITNHVVVSARPEGCAASDNGYCLGHSAVFADLRTGPTDAPNNVQAVVPDLPVELLTNGRRGVGDPPVGAATQTNKRLRGEVVMSAASTSETAAQTSS
jgi:hypothetical protein